jgi:hypothetical protein
MTESEKPKLHSSISNAEEARAKALEQHLAQLERDKQTRSNKGEDVAKFTEEFFEKHVGEHERSMIRRVVLNAVADGKMEAMVYSFPSDFCTDGGRAINNHEPDWPTTLQGKAKELYDMFLEVAKPAGYNLKAMVLNFPGGIPGDIGFLLNWEAPPKQ